jgi:hypothetical protein
MTTVQFPELDANAIVATRDTLHAYSRILGDWLKACRPRRKHWWHASLRPSLAGVTTGVVNADVRFELELDLRDGLLAGRIAGGDELREPLVGQSSAALAAAVADFLVAAGMSGDLAATVSDSDKVTPGYSAELATLMADVLAAVSSTLARFRAGIAEETSPIQLWPHHFDLSMLWLPGTKIPGQDPDDEEHSDRQMNLGFTFGDDGIPEPYFYVSAYPLPDNFPDLPLPPGTEWKSGGFSGAVLTYGDLLATEDPEDYLLSLWNGLLAAGREQMLSQPR